MGIQYRLGRQQRIKSLPSLKYLLYQESKILWRTGCIARASAYQSRKASSGIFRVRPSLPLSPPLPSSGISPTIPCPLLEILFNAALAKYCKETGEDLRNHPLAARINSCDSPESVLNVFQQQAQAFEESRRDDARLFKWLIPVVIVLQAFSTNAILSDGVSLVSPADFLIVHSVCFNSIP